MFFALLSAMAAAIAAQAAPGPNLLAVASVALSRGRLPAVLVAAGVATGVWVWVTACVFGVSALFTSYPQTRQILQLIGGCYLLYIAIRAFLATHKGGRSMIRGERREMSPGAAYRRGLLVVLTNPKAAMMWIAITAFLFGAGLNPGEVMWIAPAGSLSALLVYSAYAWLFSTPVAVRSYTTMSGAFEIIFAGLFALLGMRLLYDGSKQLVIEYNNN